VSIVNLFSYSKFFCPLKNYNLDGEITLGCTEEEERERQTDRDLKTESYLETQ
jgi:hypothetical protein